MTQRATLARGPSLGPLDLHTPPGTCTPYGLHALVSDTSAVFEARLDEISRAIYTRQWICFQIRGTNPHAPEVLAAFRMNPHAMVFYDAVTPDIAQLAVKAAITGHLAVLPLLLAPGDLSGHALARFASTRHFAPEDLANILVARGADTWMVNDDNVLRSYEILSP